MPMQVAGPVRGTYNAEGRFFAVAGNTLFQITTGGISVPLGTVPGVGRVSFSHNQITNGNEILVNNGNSGYIYNTVTQVFQRITDTSYPGGLRAVFINNRFVQIEPARRYLFNSALADGLGYTALDRFTSETSPDLAMGIESIGNQLAVFSSTTTEWFEDTGANPQPFRSTGIVADKGAAGPFATAKMDNQLFFLADDGVFYRYQGYNPVRISTKPIEQAIRNKNWFNAFTTVWEDSGYAVCYWTFPDGHTWGYDASAGKWHRRESYGLNRWRLNSLTYWQNAWYGGDFQSGRLWQLDWDYLLEGDQEFESIRACGVIADNQNRVIHERLELVMNTGMVETTPVEFVDQPEGPSISGTAPNSTPLEPYSFSYTTTPGDAPIARTVLMPGSFVIVGGNEYTIPSNGWSWNQATATISSADAVVGTVTLNLRVYDTNGLYADHSDSFNILDAYELLISGTPIGTGNPLMCSLLNVDTSDITAIPQSSGADITSAVATHDGTQWCAASASGARYVASIGGSWTSATSTVSYEMIFPDGDGGFIADSSGQAYGTDMSGNFSALTMTATNPAYQIYLNDNNQVIKLEDYYYGLTDVYLFRCSDPRIDTWDMIHSHFGDSAKEPTGLCWHQGQMYMAGLLRGSTIYGVTSSPDGGVTWPISAEEFTTAETDFPPLRIWSFGDVLVTYCNGGVLRCNTNGWETIPLGIQGISTGGSARLLAVRSRIMPIAGLLYILGAGTDSDKMVIFNPQTLEVSAPITLPITSAVGIASRNVV